ncbi:MAG: PfkB family carbohydrate kinase [Chloroflexota bacterium]
MPALHRQMPSVDVAMIGHFALDRLIFGGREETSPGGSVYYGALALRRMGLSVAVITRLRETDFPRLEELRAAGVLVYAHPAAETSGIENTYLSQDMDRRLCRPLGFAGPFRREDLPEPSARTFIVGPIIAGEVDIPLVEALSRRAPVALDAQGFVRVRKRDDLVFQDWSEKARGLALVQVLKVDAAEAEVLTGRTDLHQAARILAEYGPREIVLTHASGLLVLAQRRYFQAPWTSRQLSGRTGRGDTCLAAYVGKRLETSPEEACRFAAALTSLKMETPGPFRGTMEDVQARLTQATRQERLEPSWRNSHDL